MPSIKNSNHRKTIAKLILTLVLLNLVISYLGLRKEHIVQAQPNIIAQIESIKDKTPPIQHELPLSCDPQIYYGVQHCADGNTHVILVDLNDSHVHLQTVLSRIHPDGAECNSVNPNDRDPTSNCPYPYPFEPITSMLSRYISLGAVAIINTDYFGCSPDCDNPDAEGDHGAQGLAVRNGVRLDGPEHGVYNDLAYTQPSLAISPSNIAIIGIPGSQDVINANLSGTYYNTVAGAPIIVEGGQLGNINCTGSYPGDTCSQASQSAAGLTSEGQLVLVTAPINAADVADYLITNHQVHTALKFDGGGSASQAWLDSNGQIQFYEVVQSNPLRPVAEGLLVFSTRVSHEKPFSNWFPWYYLISTGDYRVTDVYLDGQLLFERPDCAIALWVGAGDHTVRFYYEDPGAGIPEVEINAWPFVEPACAAPPSDPPPTDPPPSGEVDNATFVTDVTIPDWFPAEPGQALLKTWRMRNTGTTTWGSGYQLVFINGEQMGAPSAVDVPTTAPNQEVDISVNLVAPLTGGDHIGYWRLRNSEGTYFGDTIWVSIHVPDGQPQPPNSDITLTCLNCPTNVTPGQTFRPTIHATVYNGQLLESRGDMLRNKDGNLFGAWPHIAVIGTVNGGQSYDFTF